MAQKKHSKKHIVVGNWKMNPQTFVEAKKLFTGIAKEVGSSNRTQAILALPYVYLGRLSGQNISLAAQDVFFEDKGAFTGKISTTMLADSGVAYVIVGHSESRKFGDTNQTVNRKIHAIKKAGLTPIVCIGEETRNDEGHHLDFLRTQIQESFKGLTKKDLEKVIIAYEPIWAIGGVSAMTPHDVHETSLFIKKVLRETWKGVSIPAVRILYGGSVEVSNAASIVSGGEVDGLLVGRQSLDIDSFWGIIKSLNDL